MGRYRIAVLPGDGIGPEVMDAALHVLHRLAEQSTDLEFEFTSHAAGAAHYRDQGEALPAAVLEDCRKADAILLSAIGLPDVRKPDGTEPQPDMMVGLRRALKLSAAVRPIKAFPGVPSVLRDVGEGIDFVIVRENLEGLFASYGGGTLVDDAVATETLVITRAGTQRVCEYAFRLAQRRGGRPLDGQQRVTCVDKANIFRSFAFFRKVFHEVAAGWPEIASDAVYVDAMSLYMLLQPEAFDVLVMENQFGDILSDLGAGLVGGLGMAPSAEIGDRHALFQPSHGSAPQLAGLNAANPIAMILSSAMMLDWLGDRHGDAAAREGACVIERAVERALSLPDGKTADLGGTASTTDVAECIARQL